METRQAPLWGLARWQKDFMDRYRALIELLAAERRRLGLNQQELADRLGQRQQFVSRYELGERRLDVIEFIDVAAALGLSTNVLIAGVEPRAKP